MTELAATPGQLPAKQTSDDPSPELWRRLRANDSWKSSEWAQDAAGDTALVEAIREALPAIQERAKAAGAKAVVSILFPLMTVFPQAERSDAEWKTFWGLYTDALEDLPIEALKAGVAEFVRLPDAKWFPMPGPLRALCEKTASPLRGAAYRAELTLKVADGEVSWLRPIRRLG